MSSSACERRALGLVLATAVAALPLGCGLDPEAYQYGFVVTGDEFSLLNENVGVHPNPDILIDPNNPFREYGVGSATKFEILASGGSVAAFYAWGTLLANQPNGEHQYFTSFSLANIYRAELAPPEQLEQIRTTAIAGFQAQLDEFPEAVTFTDAVTSRRLATDAYLQIEDLGGTVLGDWELVLNAEGQPVAVRSAPVDPGRAEEDPAAGIGEGIDDD